MALFAPNPETLAQGFEAVQRHLSQQDTVIGLLERLATQEGPGLQTLAVTETEVGGGIEADFPVPGSRRWIIPRVATGGRFKIPNSLVTLLEANNRRLGGTVVNVGEIDVELILANPTTATAQAGLGSIFLRAGGGSWDFRLGSLMWCGSVCAKALAEAGSVLTVVEV